MKIFRFFKLKDSLLSKYVLIILCAMILLPMMLPVVSLLTYLPLQWRERVGIADERYRDAQGMEKMWHAEAAKLGGASEPAIAAALRDIQARYPKAAVFRVDAQGRTGFQLPENPDRPDVWTTAYTVAFMKERFYGDPYTIIAFVGEGQDQGFIGFELPRSAMLPSGAASPYGSAWIGLSVVLGGAMLILALFLFISLLFFSRIRRRLVRLQAAMTDPAAAGGIPAQVVVLNGDEIGRLEQAFNDMVAKLAASRAREAEEDALRRELIAKLSHDLRTPLTAIRSHAYSLQAEQLSERGAESVAFIESKTGYLGQLIENLFSYSLLSAGKYPYRPERVDIVRLARTFFIGWYPVFEQAGFEIDLELPEETIYWKIDPQWLGRVLDNYCQNALRHARSGRYVRFALHPEAGGRLVIEDHGPGMSGSSPERGAGLGLSIAALMLKEMELRSDVRTGETGTCITIAPHFLNEA
ncbi:histidine kinase dimerization/phospho-acceptor domain-containing protein [Paenibacillus aurantiacus]|uniref:histidine kinase n=1 Tax=Paenibacillus aurantiacus TaxID=1936118 RepID=A0ABV5KNX1_9BACL